MKLSVLKNNVVYSELDLSAEVSRSDENESCVFYIGRAQDCHLVLDDMQISRYHAEIHFKNDQWTLVNTSELIPIIVNGSAVQEANLNSGDMINLPPYTINVFIPHVAKAESFPEDDIPVVNNLEETDVIDSSSSEEELEKEAEELLGEETIEASQVELDDTSLETDEKVEEAEQEAVSDESDSGFSSDFSEDSEQEDGEFPTEYDEDDAGFGDGEKTNILTNFFTLKFIISGEYAPYDEFSLDEGEILIGRDADKCKIVLKDPDVSSIHAKIRRDNATVYVEDMKSLNGTILNGAKINSAQMHNTDELIVGSTTLTLKIASSFIKEEKGRLMPVEEGQVQEVIEEVEEEVEFDEDLDFSDNTQKSIDAPEGASIKSASLVDKWKGLDQRKKMIYGVIGLLVLWILLEEEEPKKTAKKSKKKDSKIAGKDKKKEKVGPIKKDATSAERSKAKLAKMSKEDKEFIEAQYLLAKEFIAQGKYAEAIFELDKFSADVPIYKESEQLRSIAKQGLARLEELEQKRQAEIERKIRQEKIKKLLAKATTATKDRQSVLAESLFNQILELDPENLDVTQLKLEIEAWKKEQERIALEKAQIEAERKRMVDSLLPSKKLYLKKDWFRAIIHLEKFLTIKRMDEDLVKEATAMLEESRQNLKTILSPLVGKARSLKEGQDLKGAYEAYREVLHIDPTNDEAMKEMEGIIEVLTERSKKIYREAIIAESLSLFIDAKEKLQEVQQVSPIDSEYYEKATEKLKNYLE